MEIFPNGFIMELHALVSPDAQGSAADSFVDTRAGEYLLPPSLAEVVTGGEVSEAQCFLGVDSLAGSSDAEVRIVRGPEYLDEVLRTARLFGADADDEAMVLDMVLKLSEMLRRFSGAGISRVRRTAETPGELLPVG